MKLFHKQKGMSGWSMLGLAMVFGFIGLLVIKLTPVYVEGYSALDVAKKLEEDMALLRSSHREIDDKFFKRLNINSVRSVTKDNVTIKKTKDHVQFVMDYEVRVPIAYNVDAMVRFKHEFEKDL